MDTSRWRRGVATAAVVAAIGTAGVALPATPALAASTSASSTASTTTTPTYDTWVQDVSAVTDTAQSYVAQRTASAGSGEKLAIVLDIDNTSLATYFKGGYPTPATPGVLKLAQYAHAHGVSVFFVTARPDFIETVTEYNLDEVGYPVDGLYGRSLTDLFGDVSAFKTAQRAKIEDKGYTIIANVGNNTTDLTGGHAEQTYKLPDYDGLLD
ncbi:HAD family acid phosphatase [Streptomyces sp. NPDC059373]